MRRVIGLVLVGLGAFALVAALMVRAVLAPSVVKLPLDQDSEPTAVAADLDWFDIGAGKQHTGELGSVNQTVTGDPGAAGAGDDVAVWSIGTVVLAEDGETVVNASDYRACLDRTKAVAVADCDSARGTEAFPDAPQGLTVTFPFDTQKKSYDVYNSTTGKTFPAEYVGTEQLEGLTVYRFEQKIPETVIQTSEVPGPMAGAPAGTTVSADVVYSNTRTTWVEPTSGVVVTAEEHPDTYVQAVDGGRGVTILSADITAAEDTLADQVDTAKDTRKQISTVKTVLPLVLLVVGVLALAGGLLLTRRRPAGAHRVTSTDETPEPVLQDR